MLLNVLEHRILEVECFLSEVKKVTMHMDYK